jgi:hypothetical protein
VDGKVDLFTGRLAVDDLKYSLLYLSFFNPLHNLGQSTVGLHTHNCLGPYLECLAVPSLLG